MKKTLVAGLSLLALLGACASEQDYHPTPGETMHLTQETWKGFKEYQALIGPVNDGAFAVTSDGRGYFYRYCRSSACVNGSATAAEALRSCEREGAKCYLFARGNDIKVDYQVSP